MTLKEAISDDMYAEGGFFDPEEFAEEHTIDGKKVNCIVQRVDIDEANISYGLMKATLNPKEKAVYRDDYIIHIRTDDVREKITTNSRIVFDGTNMFVHAVKKFTGYMKIQIGRDAV